jgi:hypothetical protein
MIASGIVDGIGRRLVRLVCAETVNDQGQVAACECAEHGRGGNR